jgi:hypothetical protein
VLIEDRLSATQRPGRVCKRLQPEQDHAEVEHNEGIDSPPFAARGDAPGPLGTVDQAAGIAVDVGLALLVFLVGIAACAAERNRKPA